MRVHYSHPQVRSEVNGGELQNARRAENIQGGPICHRCSKPMRLARRFNHTGTRQVWYCTGCFIFRIVGGLVEYTVSDAQPVEACR